MKPHSKIKNPYDTEEYKAIEGDEYKAFSTIDSSHKAIMRSYGIDVRLNNLIVDLTNGWIFDRMTGISTKINIRKAP